MLPVPRIFIPNHFLARIADADQVNPTILVYIHAIIEKRIAESSVRIENKPFGNFMSFPIRRFEPEGTGHNIHQPITVDVAHRYAFRYEILCENDFFEPDRIPGLSESAGGKKQDKNQRQGKTSHRHPIPLKINVLNVKA